MKRGDIWTVAAGGGYGGKPRPAVVLQDDHFVATASVTVCLFTSDPTIAPLFRLPVAPDGTNGLPSDSVLMVDKLVTIPRAKVAKHVGRLSDADMARLEQAVLVFLGMAD